MEFSYQLGNADILNLSQCSEILCTLLGWNNSRNGMNVRGRNMKHINYLLRIIFCINFLLSLWVIHTKPDFFNSSANVAGSSPTELGAFLILFWTEKHFTPLYLQWLLVNSKTRNYKKQFSVKPVLRSYFRSILFYFAFFFLKKGGWIKQENN